MIVPVRDTYLVGGLQLRGRSYIIQTGDIAIERIKEIQRRRGIIKSALQGSRIGRHHIQILLTGRRQTLYQ
jgi:hypothetical protein